MDVILQIIQISLFAIAGLCYIITSIKKYIAKKEKEKELLKNQELAKSKLFEMYKKYFKENQSVEQAKTTTQEIKELEQEQGEL